MKFLPIILSLISAISFGLAIYFIFMNTNQFNYKKRYNKTIIISLILLAISLVIIAYTIDYLVDIYKEPQDFNKDFSKIGTYGDFFGGILNPILAFIGIIAASLAFYAQYEANKQVQVQFEEQKEKENLDYIYNKFNSQIQLILDEINKFQLSHYYPFYSKDMPVIPEVHNGIGATYKSQQSREEYYEKMKEYHNSKKYEKRIFEGVIAINELFLLLNKIDNFRFMEDYFNKSFDNPKVNEVYNILLYLNLTISEVENSFYDNLNLKNDLISKLVFLYNTKLSTIVNNNLDNLPEDNLLKVEMNKLSVYFNSQKNV